MADGQPTGSTDGGELSRPAEPSTHGAARAPMEDQPTVVTSRDVPSAEALPPAVLPKEIGPALVGSTLGHFRLDEYVGGGGMGVVFRAHDLSLDRSVAVKVLSQQQTEESLARFRNEAQSAARLDHPHIARVYYVGEDRGWYYIVFEYIDGVNIRDLVAHRGPLPIDEVISYTLQIASAIDHAWLRHVIHRDIKPSNILVMEDGQAKLVDMGLARLHQQPVSADEQDLTASGVTLGTFDYISPEQARDPRSADVRSDLYSLGCTMYFMLTGQPPFPEGTVLQKLLSHSSETPPDPRQWRPDLPDSLVRIVNRLLAKRPEDRYQSPAELIAALVAVADEMHLAIADPLFRQRVRLEPQRAAWWEQLIPWSVGAALVVAAAVVVQWFPYGVSNAPIPDPQFADTPYALTSDGSASPAADRESDTAPADSGAEDTGAVDDTDRDRTTPVESASGTEQPADPSPPMGGGESTSPPEESAPRPAAILVGPLAGGLPESTFSTLDEALRFAADHPEVTELTLAWDGPQPLAPQSRSWSLITNRSLTLRSAPGHDVQIVVATSDETLVAATGRPTMIPLGEARWHFEGIHWVWELAEELAPREGWTLFGVTGETEATWRHCSFTVANADAQGYRVHPNVALIQAGSTIGASSMAMPNVKPAPELAGLGPQIWMENCSVRGETTLMREGGTKSVLFSWQGGVLATTERAVVVEGLPMMMTPPPRLELLFEDVLFFAQSGLLLTQQASSQPILPEVAWHAVHCVVVVEESEPPVAVLEQKGVQMDEWRPPEITGGRNRYAGTDVMLRVQSRSPTDTPLRYTLEDLRMKPPHWYGEELPQPLTRSPWNFRDTAPSRVQLSELLDGPDARRMLSVLQFDGPLLDALPRFPRRD